MLLEQARADPQLCDVDGKTALHRAAVGGHLDVCKYLLEVRPSLRDIVDNKNMKPKDYAVSEDVRVLLNEPAESSPSGNH